MGSLFVSRSTARLSFAHFLRTGLRLPEDAFEATLGPLEAKFNPYHDPRNGQFTFGRGGAAKTASYFGMTAKGGGLIRPTSGGDMDPDGRPIPEQFAPDPYALSNPTAALAHYVGGSGEDRNYYFNNVDTSQVRLNDFPTIMTLANGAKPGIYPVVEALGSYNGDFLGLHDSSSWATVGGLKLRANGVPAIGKDGQYRFNGSLSADPDPYDFNRRSGRSIVAETLTTIGRHIPGKRFNIYLIGSKPYSTGGGR